ncbi:claudin-23-like [Chiloscyllium plagiosum]|uniref:claudin-23-like n=1 Tax=Chiloscyllium plagiosum TaxID=36176 RepID=UPI001CB7C09F|nr:claudin-23-like [Chiloscyllium plagiosum]XP_043530330.1 claudin-23-like [Chiloscyllium plagiosum]
MRTPAVMILGLVLSPAGYVLVITCLAAPAWRDVSGIPNGALDEVHHQGLWEICKDEQSVRELTCGLADDSYFNDPVLAIARGLMIASLVVSAAGILVTTFGVRCWTDIPHYRVAGVGGIILVLGGILTLIPVSWYTHLLRQIPNTVGGTDLNVGYAVVLGFVGGSLITIAGIHLMFSFGKLLERHSPANKTYYPTAPAYPASRYPTGITNPVTVIDLPVSSRSTSTPWDADL